MSFNEQQVYDSLLQIDLLWRFDGERRGLQSTDWMILRFVSRANTYSRTPSGLARFLRCKRASLSSSLNNLEREGYLVRSKSVADGRTAVLSLTQKALKLLSEDPVWVFAKELLKKQDTAGWLLALQLALSYAKEMDGGEELTLAATCNACLFFAPGNNACRYFRQTIREEDRSKVCLSFQQDTRAAIKSR